VHFANHVDIQEPALAGIPGSEIIENGQALPGEGAIFASSQPSAAHLQLIPPTPQATEPPLAALPDPVDAVIVDVEQPDARADDVMEEVVIPRTPTPPLPDFILDEHDLDRLQAKLVDDTSRFTIEQLEQLRASCLGVVWNHRKEWDRSSAIRELVGMIDEIAAEVHADSVGSP